MNKRKRGIYMALKTYVGARYAPKFMGAWDKNSEYAALSVVYTNDRSFVSRKTVPANTEILNTEYWIQSSDWNAQVAEYNELVQQYHDATEEYNKNVEAYNSAVSKFYADTLHSYRTKVEMVADASLKLEDTVLTCGDKAIGDTGGSFYRIVDKTSSKAVALENGLFAEPFEFQPYDYSEFATKTDEYKTQTDEQIQQYKETTDQQIEQIRLSSQQLINEANQSASAQISAANTAAQAKIDQMNTNAQTQITNANNAATAQRNALVAVSLRNYDNENSMKADTSLEIGNTILTSGASSVGDGSGKFWRVQGSSASGTTLNNGLKAVPFTLMPYSVLGNVRTSVTTNSSSIKINFSPTSANTVCGYSGSESPVGSGDITISFSADKDCVIIVDFTITAPSISTSGNLTYKGASVPFSRGGATHYIRGVYCKQGSYITEALQLI